MPFGDPNLSEQKFAGNEDRFRALVTAISDVIYSVNADWTVMRELDGLGFLKDTNEPITNWRLRIYPDDLAKVNDTVNEAIKEKKIFKLEHRVLRIDGSVGWMFSRAVPILDNNGNIIEWFGISTDISERKNTEANLKEIIEHSAQQKRLYETITASTPDLMYVFDLNYHFTYANEALLNMWGKSWDDAIGKGLLENGYEPWHAEMHEREIDKVKETKKSIRGEVSFPHATLGRRVYDYIFTPVFNYLGEVEAVAGTTRDITDIRNAEIAISESEARFRIMAEGTDVMIAVSDELGNDIYFNEAWTALTGRTKTELIRQGWIDLVHPEDKDRITKTVSIGHMQKEMYQFEYRIADKKNSYRWLLSRATPRIKSDGTYIGYVCSTVDITEIKENEQRKNDFINMVSHELKTPLTSAISYVQMSEKKAVANDDERTASMLERAGKQLRKMTGMINGFLNISRLESGKIHMERHLFDIASLLKEAEAETAISVTTHKVLFTPVTETFVNADREKIGQVISNLISNAVKYSPLGSTIQVSCNTVDENVRVSITDKGIGVNKEDLPRLFERYYRVTGNDTRHISGFGIGLYICSEIIKGHGGEIWAESSIGKGSTFNFTLPLAENSKRDLP